MSAVSIDIIYRDYYSLFVNFANKIINNKEAAKDIAQNAIIKFYSKADSFREIEEVRAYLIKIIKSKCYSYHKHNYIAQRYNKYVLGTENESVEYESSFDQLEKEILIKRIYELIDQLHPQQRKIFIMIHVHKIPAKEVAEKLGISWSTVRVQYKNCVGFFRKNIKKAPR